MLCANKPAAAATGNAHRGRPGRQRRHTPLCVVALLLTLPWATTMAHAQQPLKTLRVVTPPAPLSLQNTPADGSVNPDGSATDPGNDPTNAPASNPTTGATGAPGTGLDPATGAPTGPSPTAPPAPPAGTSSPPPATPPPASPPPRQPGSLIGRSLPGVTAVVAPGNEAEADHEPREIVAISPDMEAAQALARQLAAERISVRGRFVLTNIGVVLTRFRLPAGEDARRWLPALRKALPDVSFDLNHRYTLQAGNIRRYGQRLFGAHTVTANCGAGTRIGMVDTAVAMAHPALQGQQIRQRSFLTAGERPAPGDHGTAVAALLVGSARAGELAGLAPGAELVAATVFRQRGERTDTTVVRLLRALDFLQQQKVRLINLSLAGSENRLLQLAIEAVTRAGTLVIAAAGNTGSRVQYPAAWPEVLAVTAVDARLRPYAHASRGKEIDFAAPGVDVWTARADGSAAFASGTSYAVPFVSAALAGLLAAQPDMAAKQAVAVLRTRLRDLGAKGRDPVFGDGLVQWPGNVCQS